MSTWPIERGSVETEVQAGQRVASQVASELDRLVLDIRDIPSTSAAVRRLVELLRGLRQQATGPGWSLIVEALRGHEIGRLLRTDPMIRRCQWRPVGTDPYHIIEAFVMGWDDTEDSLIEAEQPGCTLNTVFLSMGLAAALRERRSMIHGYFAAAAGAGHGCAVLGLGAAPAPEVDLLAPVGALAIDHWVAVDPSSTEDAVIRRKQSNRVEWRTEPLADYLEKARGTETFDLIYAVNAIDRLDDRQAAALIEKALVLLRPNGRLVMSALAPDLPEAAYVEAALDWRPNLRAEADLDALFKTVPFEGRLASTVWRGGSGRVAFGTMERLSWAA